MAKINSIKISGLRGVKEPLSLNLNKKSILIYGDNGTGKSSITDSFEWFFYDRIEHLSNEEIGRRKGKDAVRNIFIPDTEDGYIELKFDDNNLDSKKSIDNSLRNSLSNTSDELNNYLSASSSERLILRYRDLVQFIIAGKTDKLTELQKIIGFSDVANLRALLKKSAGRIARNIKAINYDNLKNIQQRIILENLERNSYSDEQLFEGANELIKPLKLDFEIKSRTDINAVLKKIESKEDTALIEQINYHMKVWEVFSELQGNIEPIANAYKTFYDSFVDLQKDPEKIKKLQLLSLLQEGQSVLSKDVVKEDYCPLCLQEKSKISLLQELNERILDLEQLSTEKKKLDEKAKDLESLIKTSSSSIDTLTREKLFSNEKFISIKEKIELVKSSLNVYSEELKKDFTVNLIDPQDLTFDKLHIEEFIEHINKTKKALTETKESNIKFKVYTKLMQASKAYVEYLRIEKEQKVLIGQQTTFELLYEDFIIRQEEALNVFLSMFSKDINDYYTTMNPKEKINDIKLVPIKKDDELVGITIEYSFFNEVKTPPIAYLSESHINCLGLSFFLASVKAFNKQNKFFILDDVISSFDRSHRYRFAQLLANKFNDYQVVLLTHEKEFFQLVSSEVKSKGWLLNSFKWSMENGTGIEKGLADIKERIVKKFEEKILMV